MTTPLVIGLGHADRGDDGLGLVVANEVRRLGPLPVLTGLADPAALVAAWQGRVRVVVVDAVADGRAPGTLVRLDLRRDLPAVPRVSMHGASLATAIALARSLDAMPSSLVLHGASGVGFGLGDAMHPAVAAAVAPLVAAVLDELGTTAPP